MYRLETVMEDEMGFLLGLSKKHLLFAMPWACEKGNKTCRTF